MVDPASPLFQGLPTTLEVWMSHGDRVARMPEGFALIGRSDRYWRGDCPGVPLHQNGLSQRTPIVKASFEKLS